MNLKRGKNLTQECVRLWISWIFPDLGDIPPICEKTHCRAISIIISPVWSFLCSASYICKPPQRVLTQPASTIIFGVTIFYRQDKTRLGVNNWFLHWTSAINCLNANLCVRFLDSSWYLFQLESRGTNVELWETSNGFATLPDRVGRRVGTSW